MLFRMEKQNKDKPVRWSIVSSGWCARIRINEYLNSGFVYLNQTTISTVEENNWDENEAIRRNGVDLGEKWHSPPFLSKLPNQPTPKFFSLISTLYNK